MAVFQKGTRGMWTGLSGPDQGYQPDSAQSNGTKWVFHSREKTVEIAVEIPVENSVENTELTGVANS